MAVKMIVLATLVLAAASEPDSLLQDMTNPIVGVIAMLKANQATSEAEGKTETAAWSKTSYWFKTQIADMTDKVKEHNEKIAAFEDKKKAQTQVNITLYGDLSKIAEIDADLYLSADEKTSQKKEIQGEIADLGAEIAANDASALVSFNRQAAQDIVMQNAQDDFNNTEIAVDEVIAILATASQPVSTNSTANANYTGSQHPTFLMQLEGEEGVNREAQVAAQEGVSRVLALLSMETSDEEQDVLVDFVNSDFSSENASMKSSGDKQNHVKKFTSKLGKVVEMMKKLKIKFATDLRTALAENAKAQNAYLLSKLSRDNAKTALVLSSDQKIAKALDNFNVLTQTIADLGTEKQTRDTQVTDMNLMKTQQATRTAEWKERSTLRANEINALSTAAKILAKVSGLRSDKPQGVKAGVQQVSFLQVVNPQTRGINLLRASAKAADSRVLDRLVSELSGDPKKKSGSAAFNEVFDQVQKVILKMNSDQIAQTRKKNSCDGNIGKTAAEILRLTTKIQDLINKQNSLQASIDTINVAINLDLREVKVAEANIAEAIAVRNTNKEENKIAIKDAEAAEAALDNAIAVLEKMYADTAATTSDSVAVATINANEPSSWGAAFGTSQGSGSGGNVVAMLQTVAAGFTKMAADTKAQEAEEAHEYNTQMHQFKHTKEQEAHHAKVAKEVVVRKTDEKHTTHKSQLLAGQQLDSANTYMAELQSSCAYILANYTVDKTARATTIGKMRNATGILRDSMKPGAINATLLEVHAH